MVYLNNNANEQIKQKKKSTYGSYLVTQSMTYNINYSYTQQLVSAHERVHSLAPYL